MDLRINRPHEERTSLWNLLESRGIQIGKKNEADPLGRPRFRNQPPLEIYPERDSAARDRFVPPSSS